MATVDTSYTFPDNHRGALSGLIDASLALIQATDAPQAIRQRHRKEVAENAKALAGNVARSVREKPLVPALAAAGLGVALVFLLSGRARGAAKTAGAFALDQYRKRV